MWLIAVLKKVSFKIIVISLMLMDIVETVLRGNTFMVPKGGPTIQAPVFLINRVLIREQTDFTCLEGIVYLECGSLKNVQ